MDQLKRFIVLDIKTDGTLTPSEALKKASGILVEQFSILSRPRKYLAAKPETKTVKKKASEVLKAKVKKARPQKTSGQILKEDISFLKLSTRITNSLREQDITTIKQLMDIGEVKLKTFSGIGAKAIKEIRRKLGRLGLILKK